VTIFGGKARETIGPAREVVKQVFPLRFPGPESP
jgi:hypothetical protein